MDLYLQMGHGMQSLGLDLLDEWGAGTLILSPLNISQDKIINFSKIVHKKKGNVLLDPQLYYPRKNHKKLTQYSYWPKENITSLENGECDMLLKDLTELNKKLNSSSFILPSFTVNVINNRWNSFQKCIIEKARKYDNSFSLLHTLALSASVIKDNEQIDDIIAYISKWDVDGVYIVCEHPTKQYLVDEPLWLANLLALASGIKRLGKKVIVGYANHQLLCMGLSKCDAIAAGVFLNVRWFKPSHFETNDDEETSRRSVWYFCPQALSEYKIPFLDIAYNNNILNKLKPTNDMLNKYCDMLFKDKIMPSTADYKEGESFRHYLNCLRKQSRSIVLDSYEKTYSGYSNMLQDASKVTSFLKEYGIKGQDRDFSNIVDVNTAAIIGHSKTYKFIFSQEWNSL